MVVRQPEVEPLRFRVRTRRHQFLTRSRIRATTSRTPSDSKELLRHHGLQVTTQRVAILEAVEADPHCTADAVETAATERLGSISHQAVYDGLAALVDGGLLRRIQPSGSPARFEMQTGDNHHHLVCRSCGRMVDADCATGHAPCLEPADAAGYEVDEAEVVFWGQCPDCRVST